MNKKTSSSTSASSLAVKRAAAAKRARDDWREKKSLESLAEPPHKLPLENSGLSGASLQKKIAKYRADMEKTSRRQIKKGASPIRLHTLKESVLQTIQTYKAQGSRQRFTKAPEELPLGELHPFLPRFDWRDYKVVTAVRSQANDPRCWAYAATQAFECSLMIQRANFATSTTSRAPEQSHVQRVENIFWVDMVELNARSTFECLKMVNDDGVEIGGRFESAFNFYLKRGIPAHEIKLWVGIPVTDAPGVDLILEDRYSVNLGIPDPKAIHLDEINLPPSGQAAETSRDAALPLGHCKGRNNRVKAKGWDYVRGKNPWKIPTRDALKKALLEHGPLAVSTSLAKLNGYGQKIDAHCTEVGRSRKTGVIFREDPVTKDMFVRFPRKILSLGQKEGLVAGGQKEEPEDTKGAQQFHMSKPHLNLNFTTDELAELMMDTMNNRVIRGPAAQCFRQGRHHRQAKKDRDVGTFYDSVANEIVLHFPASNAVLLKTDRGTGEKYLSFPVNTETKFSERTPRKLFFQLPCNKEFEDIAPVLHPDRNGQLDHDVLLVGWDDQKHAWIIQNSWGEDWGYQCNPQRGTRGYGYVAYGTFGHFAAWIESPLLKPAPLKDNK